MSIATQSIDIDTLIGQRLAALRRERGITQKALGAALHVTFQQVQKYERGTNRVSAARLLDAALFFGVPVATFYEGADGADALPPSTHDPVLAGEAARLAAAFTALPADERRAVMILVAGMAEQHGSTALR